MIVANDPEIKGGTYYPITVHQYILYNPKVKKHIRA